MEEQWIVIGIVVLIFSTILNAILNIKSRGKKGWGGGGPLLGLSMLSFAATMYSGYKLGGGWGVAGAFIVQVIGMAIMVAVLQNRVQADRDE